jgi:hypothetical protein
MTPSTTAPDTTESGGGVTGKDDAVGLGIYDMGPDLRL